MNFVREIVEGKKIADIIDIPSEFINQEVEVLIFPMVKTKVEKKKSKLESLYGKYAKYANPELRKKEDSAWMEAAHEWK